MLYNLKEYFTQKLKCTHSQAMHQEFVLNCFGLFSLLKRVWSVHISLLRESNIMDRGLEATVWSKKKKKKLLIDLLQTCTFLLPKTLLDGLESHGLLVYVTFSLALYHSDGTYWLYWPSNVMQKFLQICSSEESWMAWGWIHFNFWVSYYFKSATLSWFSKNVCNLPSRICSSSSTKSTW